MDVLSGQDMIAREKEAFASGITAEALMEAAGKAMAERIRGLYPRASNFLIFVGKGNNGGDGLVVARHLAKAGRCVEVVLSAAEKELGDLPRAHLAQLRQASPAIDVMPWSEAVTFPYAGDVVIDGLLGVQAKGPLRGDLALIVAAMNAARRRNFFRVIALDLPTGLAAYEGKEAPKDPDAAVIADATLPVGFAKDVLVREDLSAWVGRLEIMPWSTSVSARTNRQVLVPWELAGLLPRRGALSFKNDFGKIAIVAGSRGFTGAPVLCVHAAQGIGAGLLSVTTHRDVADIVASQAPPEAMVSGWDDLNGVPEVIAKASAIVIGPGLGVSGDSLKMLRAVLAVGCPVLVDADGLNLLAKELDLLDKAKGPVVLTPHVGEMGRLTGKKVAVEERETVARAFVEKHNVTLVLKGTRTLVTAAGQPLFINTTGNPGLSTGGTGDTLSGIIGGLLAQKLSPLDACRLGVWLHGHAADLVLAERESEEGLTPSMLSDHLGAALASLRLLGSPRKGLLECAQA